MCRVMVHRCRTALVMVLTAARAVSVVSMPHASAQASPDDGSVDASPAPPVLGKEVRAVLVQADGKVVIGGRFTGNVTRLNTAAAGSNLSPTVLSGGGGNSSVLIVVVVVAAAAVAAGGVGVARRRRSATE